MSDETTVPADAADVPAPAAPAEPESLVQRVEDAVRHAFEADAPAEPDPAPEAEGPDAPEVAPEPAPEAPPEPEAEPAPAPDPTPVLFRAPSSESPTQQPEAAPEAAKEPVSLEDAVRSLLTFVKAHRTIGDADLAAAVADVEAALPAAPVEA